MYVSGVMSFIVGYREPSINRFVNNVTLRASASETLFMTIFVYYETSTSHSCQFHDSANFCQCQGPPLAYIQVCRYTCPVYPLLLSLLPVEATAGGPEPSGRRENTDLLLNAWQKPLPWPENYSKPARLTHRRAFKQMLDSKQMLEHARADSATPRHPRQ